MPLITMVLPLMNGAALTMAVVMTPMAIHGVIHTTVPATQVHSVIIGEVHGTMDGAAVLECLTAYGNPYMNSWGYPGYAYGYGMVMVAAIMDMVVMATVAIPRPS